MRASCALLPARPALPVAIGPPLTRDAAVLVPLFEDDGEVRVVLTRRPETMPSHRGEIAFPGGKVEAHDATAVDAALREAHEEIGLAPELVEVLCPLPPLGTVTGPFHIMPFVGATAGRPELRRDEHEVARVFDVALSELMTDGVFHEEWWPIAGADRAIWFFDVEGETIWGATARILTGFLCSLTGTDDPTSSRD